MGCGQSSNPKCYLDLAINGSVIGRLVVELRTDKVPKTAENFLALCTGENGNSYKGSTIHRIVPGFIAQVIHKWVHSHLAQDSELHWSHVISMDFRKPDGNESEVEIKTKFFPFSLCFWNHREVNAENQSMGRSSKMRISSFCTRARVCSLWLTLDPIPMVSLLVPVFGFRVFGKGFL
jgi:cyclophilin family peptidyl-prolyl cis-trans isomerase